MPEEKANPSVETGKTAPDIENNELTTAELETLAGGFNANTASFSTTTTTTQRDFSSATTVKPGTICC